MGININTNVPALRANYSSNRAENALNKNLERIASGRRINGAKDDAAGLAISQTLNAQIRSHLQAERNTMDGISMLQTAEGAMSTTGDALVRMRELAVQAANGTLNDEDRAQIDKEMEALKAEIDRVSNTTEFNGKKLLDGSEQGGVSFQVGTHADGSNDQVTVEFQAADSQNLGTSSTAVSDISAATQGQARDALGTIDAAIDDISGMRAEFGAKQSELATQQKNLANQRENITAANSRIQDTDMAAEVTERIKNQILMKSATSVISQASQIPGIALALIG